MNEEKKKMIRKLFDEYCDSEAALGRCDNTDCECCAINAAAERMLNNGEV